ncbi:MAG: protein kinase [Anaerolineae bacterium]|nr:protein kinase [Anaerolineae bacterium]
MSQQLAYYEIQELLGEGSFAWVYRAFDTRLDRPVALKILKPMWMSDRQAVQRLKQEAKTMAKMHHPNIIDVYDVGETESYLYVAQFLVEGENLAERISKGPFNWDEMLEVVQDISAALDYAHSLGMIHRDIKPTNILLDVNQKPYLGDFGLVRIVEESTCLSTSTAMVGTARYVAPEIWDGKAATPATDIYALSCVVYEMLTGKVLFEGSSVMAVIKKHVDGPTFSESWPPGIPNGLTAVLQRGLARNVTQRISNAKELLSSLAGLSLATVAETVQFQPLKPVEPSLEQKADKTETFAPTPGVSQDIGRKVSARYIPWLWMAVAVVIIASLSAACLGILLPNFNNLVAFLSPDPTPTLISSIMPPTWTPTLEPSPTPTLNSIMPPTWTPTLEPMETSTLTSTPPPSPTRIPKLTTKTDLNVRAGPDVTYDLIGLLPSGTAVEIIGRDEAKTWWQIRFVPASSGVGWVTADPAFSSTENTENVSAVEIPPTPTGTPTSTSTPIPVTSTLIPTATKAPIAEIDVVIAEVIAPGEVARETLVIFNRGAGANFYEWRLEGSPLGIFVFPDIFIFNGGSIRIHTTVGETTASDLYLNQVEAAWPPGTIITLRTNNGVEITNFTVPGP